jgi:hypothetical protein
METIEKTNTNRSPLLQPIINRDYTRGLGQNSHSSEPGAASPGPVKDNEPVNTPGPGAGQTNFNKPSSEPIPGGDTTKQFAFNEENDTESDLKDGETGPEVTIPTGSARTFANTIGNLVQIYLPKATYGYVKIDIENIRMNVEKGMLGFQWIDHFGHINEDAEKALQIPDDVIKMWKAALQHYLEYKQVAFANPETEFWVATGVLLTDQGIRTYSLKKQLESYVQQALIDSHPESYVKQPVKEEKNEKTSTHDEERRAA